MDKQQKIQELLTRSVEMIYPKPEFLESLLNKPKKLTLYLGIDPTGPTLHLGHVIALKKLRHFQDLGHKIILLIGSFTAMIGDPTDKKAARQKLTREQVLENAKLYQEQASHFIRFDGENPAELRYNSEWFDRMTFLDVIELASHFTVGQMMERDMFQERVKNEKPIYLHEFLYPLMQGYDSVAMDVDGEVGGNDQSFNMLAGRNLMKSVKNKEKFVVTVKLLTDSGGKKMGKTESNMLSLINSPEDMYGKVMSWADGMILDGFELCTDVPMEEIKKMDQRMREGANPRDFKAKLARAIVRACYGKEEAQKAEAHFVSVFQKHEMPEKISEWWDNALEWEIEGENKKMDILSLLCHSGLVSSKGEARRLVAQKGVKVEGRVIENENEKILIPKDGLVLQKGKKSFIKIKPY